MFSYKEIPQLNSSEESPNPPTYELEQQIFGNDCYFFPKSSSEFNHNSIPTPCESDIMFSETEMATPSVAYESNPPDYSFAENSEAFEDDIEFTDIFSDRDILSMLVMVDDRSATPYDDAFSLDKCWSPSTQKATCRLPKNLSCPISTKVSRKKKDRVSKGQKIRNRLPTYNRKPSKLKKDSEEFENMRQLMRPGKILRFTKSNTKRNSIPYLMPIELECIDWSSVLQSIGNTCEYADCNEGFRTVVKITRIQVNNNVKLFFKLGNEDEVVDDCVCEFSVLSRPINLDYYLSKETFTPDELLKSNWQRQYGHFVTSGQVIDILRFVLGSKFDPQVDDNGSPKSKQGRGFRYKARKTMGKYNSSNTVYPRKFYKEPNNVHPHRVDFARGFYEKIVGLKKKSPVNGYIPFNLVFAEDIEDALNAGLKHYVFIDSGFDHSK